MLGRGDNPSDNESGGEQAMNGLLGKYPDIDGVLAYNDPSALGAAAASRANGRKIAAIGLNGGSDGRAGVEHGRTAATIQNDYPAQLVTLIDGIYLLKTHQRQEGAARDHLEQCPRDARDDLESSLLGRRAQGAGGEEVATP